MTSISQIVETIQGYAPDAEVGAVMNAYLLAARAHQGQTRNTGEAYLTHPLAVAEILADLRMDVDTIATALLHDALEDNPITKSEMEAQVGPVITELVDGVTKIGKLRYRSKEELQAENFRKMMLAMSRDLRVILVKLADRVHNMRTLDGHPKADKRKRIAQETLEVYAPIANRLGLTRFKSELEDLSFRYVAPEGYARVCGYLEETQAGREAYIQEVTTLLQGELERAGVDGRVSGRAKAPFSIWKKMQASGLDVADIQDLLAFRLIVPSVNDCYLMLGAIHARFEHVPGRVKDYISRAKPNGYQSLHTTVVGPKGRRIEVQIRTEDMHRVAEQGIAAHWRYKEGHLALQPEDVVRISRIREAFEAAMDAADAADFMESLKVAFYADEVFVFTPAGEVKHFPVGSTPLDFAYAIHSDVGDQCVGARIDGRMVALTHPLTSGETVEILTNAKQRPNRDWLDIAKTSRAQSKIRRYLRQQEEASAVRMGREILEAELARLDWDLERTRRDGRLDGYLDKRGLKRIEPVLAELARGHQAVQDVAKAVLPAGAWVSSQEQTNQNRLTQLFRGLGGPSTRRSRSPVLITGEDGLLVHYAGCCNPLPGEDVQGFITRGRGITVHKADCSSFARMDPERKIPVQWDLSSGSLHSNVLDIVVENRSGLLAEITTAVHAQKVGIERAEAVPTQGTQGRVRLQMAVRDLSELTRVIRAIERIDGVVSVRRGAAS